MAVSSNRRQRILEYATPKVADLVVIELVDASKNIGSADAADNTAYGTAHPDSVNFPNHKLSLIKNADREQGQFQFWYYVVDRDSQDDYNWEFQSASASGRRYDTVVRTYIILRSSFEDSTPAINSAMPISTSDPFATTDEYVLFEKRQVRAGDESLDSLYVIERRVFVKKVPIRNIRTDDSFPYDVTPHENTSDSTVDRGNTADPAKGALLDKETLYFRTEQIKATTVFASTGNDTAISVVDGSNNPVNSEEAFRDPDLSFGTNVTALGSSNFWGTDELGIEREGKQISENWFVLLERQVVPPVDITNVAGKSNPGEIMLAKYTTNETFTWPAVLNDMDPADGNQNGVVGYSWKRKKGGADTVVFPTFKRDTWTGPTKTTREIIWRKKKWSDSELTDLQPMQPLPINFITPLARASVKPTLHKGMQLGMSTGNNHPIYNDASTVFTYGRTNYTDWPEELVVSDSQKPFRGGYVRERITVHAPTISAQNPTYAPDPF